MALTIDDAHNEATKHAGYCLATEYINNKTKMPWMCAQKHIFLMNLGHVKSGHWCKICAYEDKKLSLLDAQTEAQKQGGYCLAEHYENCYTLMPFKCKNNHLFSSTLSRVRNGYWCAQCSDQRLSIEIADWEATQRGGHCLSKEYINIREKLSFVCKNNHFFKMSLGEVRYNHYWCPECSHHKKLTIEVAKKEAEKHGWILISKTYKNCDTPLEWMCENGHMFFKSLYKAKNLNQECPLCKNKNSRQEKIKNNLEEILLSKAISNCRKLNCLKNPETGRNLEMDLWFPELYFGAECDGRQHFGISSMYCDNGELENIQYRDRLKDELVKNNPNEIRYFLRIKYDEDISIPALKKKLEQIGLIT